MVWIWHAVFLWIYGGNTNTYSVRGTPSHQNSRHSGSGPVRALAPACCVRKQDGQWQRQPLLVSYSTCNISVQGGGVHVPYQARKPGPLLEHQTHQQAGSRLTSRPAPAPRLRSEADDCSTTTKSPTHWALGLGLPSSPRRRAASLPHRPPPAGSSSSSCRTHTTFPQVPFGFPPSPRRLPSARVPDLSSLPHAAGPSRGKPGLGGGATRTTTFQGPCPCPWRLLSVWSAINPRHRPLLLLPHPSSSCNQI